MTFVHFHVHTEYSRLDGASKLAGLVARAKELGQPALAMTDHGVLYGAHDFYSECVSQGIQPIIGMEAYLAPGDHTDKTRAVWGELEGRDVPGAYTHLTLLAASATGLRNLYRLHQLSFKEGFFHKQRMSIEMLKEYSDGLFCLTGCMGGALATYVRLGLIDEARKWLSTLVETFPSPYGGAGGNRSRVAVEVMNHGIDGEEELNATLIQLANEFSMDVIPTNDSHYTLEKDAAVHDAMLCIQTYAQLSDETRFRFNGAGYHLKSRAEMAELWDDQYLDNTIRLADAIDSASYAEVFAPRLRMPRPVGGVTLGDLLADLDLDGDVLAQAQYEYGVIDQAGFSDYFVVIKEIVDWCRTEGILVGPGRGSVGGSTIAFLLGITKVEALRWGCIFERFMNPERVSLPDIDLDFPDKDRQRVLEHIRDTYGAEHVGHIITYGTIKARAALKDANRVLGGSYTDGEALVAMVPPDVRGRSAPLSELKKIKAESKDVYNLAVGLEGIIRSFGVHASGIIVSPDRLGDNVPVSQRDEPLLTVGFDGPTMERLGYVKLDILGLKELTTIQRTLEMLNDHPEETT